MKLSMLLPVTLLLTWNVLASSDVKPIYQLEPEPAIGRMVTPSPAQLCDVARGTAAYLALGPDYDPLAITAGMSAAFGGDLTRVQQTLQFICQVQAEDFAAGRVSRLQDSDFLRAHFDMIRWTPDKRQAAKFAQGKPLLKNIPDTQILLTKYYIKLAEGSAKPTPTTPYALYAIPDDEANLSLKQADADRTLTRHQFTKQDVLRGVLDSQQLARPQVWLSRYDLEDSLMQGTVKVTVDGQAQFYNVHRNNGIGYQRDLAREQQGRYWYFKKTSSVLGYGKDADHKIPVHPMVTVAGDLAHLGLGKLIMLSHNGESRLTVLADTGGAFIDNQYQLDYLGGYFKDWDDYISSYRHFPDYFEARILLLKDAYIADAIPVLH